jgi:predicted secreted hydrolase
MFYRLRTLDGQASRFSSGSLIGADGTRTPLGSSDVALIATDHWTSEATGTRYPIAWQLTLRDENLTLEVEPYLQNQELDLSVRYWEGAVRATGRGPGGTVTAEGYLELAGY